MFNGMGVGSAAALLGGFFDHMPAAAFVKDARGHLVHANARFVEWMGRPREELFTERLTDLLPDEMRGLAASHDAQVQAMGQATFAENEMTLGDGVSRRLVVTKFRVPDVNEFGDGVAAILADVTRQRALQEQLHQSQKIEAIGQLTGGVAHDFNNILTVILGNIEFAVDILSDNPLAQRHLGLALKAGHRGARLVQQLLAFARRQQLMPTPTDVNQLVGETIELGKRLIPASISVRALLDTEPSSVTIDPAQLESALINLIVNARDAMPEGGTLTVSTGRARFDRPERHDGAEFQPGEYATIAVADTGTGMPAEVLARVFDPFFTTKPTGAGTGLGLSMVQGFAEQSGGHVRITSAPQRGTVVRLYLPLAAASGREAEPEEVPRRAKTGSEVVLVVEDDADVRRYLEFTLGDLGYRVLAVANGAAALAAIDGGETVDLLFTDLVLPGGLHGEALAAAARARRPGLKVLFGSGYSQAETTGGAPDAPIEILPKPYTRDALARGVDDVLDGRTGTAAYRHWRGRRFAAG